MLVGAIMRTLATLAILLAGLAFVFWPPTEVEPRRTFDTVAPQTASAQDVPECVQNVPEGLQYLGKRRNRMRATTKLQCEYMIMMTRRGYHAMLEKVGKPVEQLEAEYGDVERGLIALGCDDQAPGLFHAVLRPGDTARDYWCSQKAKERLERDRAD